MHRDEPIIIFSTNRPRRGRKDNACQRRQSYQWHTTMYVNTARARYIVSIFSLWVENLFVTIRCDSKFIFARGGNRERSDDASRADRTDPRSSSSSSSFSHSTGLKTAFKTAFFVR